MNEQKLYPDIRRVRWARICQVIALVGFGYCLLALAIILSTRLTDDFGFALPYMTAFFLLAPLELLVLPITIQSWKRWANPRQRLMTLVGSAGVLLLLGLPLFLGV